MVCSRATDPDEGTYFASAERASASELDRDVAWTGAHPVMDALLSTAGGLIAVLNEHRQLLVLNHAYLDFLGVEDAGLVLGMRPGEAVRCIHAHHAPSGCGTGRACRHCGAAIAIVSSMQTNRPNEQTCALSSVVDGVRRELELRVRAAPLRIGSRTLTMIFMEDISDAKRREALERTFLHDMNNTIQGLVGVSDLLVESAAPSDLELAQHLRALSYRIRGEVAVQRVLIGGKYVPRLEPVPIAELIGDVCDGLSYHPAAKGKRIVAKPVPASLVLDTDEILLSRVLTNMIVNALEAAATGAEVHVRADVQDAWVRLSVHNSGSIPEDVRPRIFQRYFSTKSGQGRGQGTFAMKLFGEKLLGGIVDFSSSEAGGTVFAVRLPLSS